MMPPAMTCHELAELLTAYLEGALPPEERDRFEAHRRACPACQAHVSRMRRTVSALGQLRDAAEEPSPAAPGTIVELFRTRGLHRPLPRIADAPLGLGGELAAAGDHIAYFWESEAEFEAIAGFVATGASLGEACVLVGHEAAHERVLEGLERRGLSVRELTDEGQLQVAPVRASADGLLLELGGRIKEAVHRGTPAVRILGNLNWGRGTPGWPPDEEIVRMEALVTRAARLLPCIVVCAYEVASLPGPLLMKGGFECHGLTFRRGRLRQNEHHVPPEQFLR